MAFDYTKRDRVQENLNKAFSLLDDDKTKDAQNYGAPSGAYYGAPNTMPIGAGGGRVGTAPAIGGGLGGYQMGGGGFVKSNYTGSDFGDSEIDTLSQMGLGRNARQATAGQGRTYE